MSMKILIFIHSFKRIAGITSLRLRLMNLSQRTIRRVTCWVNGLKTRKVMAIHKSLIRRRYILKTLQSGMVFAEGVIDPYFFKITPAKMLQSVGNAIEPCLNTSLNRQFAEWLFPGESRTTFSKLRKTQRPADKIVIHIKLFSPTSSNMAK